MLGKSLDGGERIGVWGTLRQEDDPVMLNCDGLEAETLLATLVGLG